MYVLRFFFCAPPLPPKSMLAQRSFVFQIRVISDTCEINIEWRGEGGRERDLIMRATAGAQVVTVDAEVIFDDADDARVSCIGGPDDTVCFAVTLFPGHSTQMTSHQSSVCPENFRCMQ